MKKLQWSKDFFDTSTKLTEANKNIAVLNAEWFSDTANLELNDEKFKFEKQGVFSSDFLIKNTTEKKVIGSIKYHSFKTRATVKIEDKEFIWTQKDFWGSQWILTDNNQTIATYKSDYFSGGKIETTSDDYLLISTGLFITNYYLKMMLAFFMIIMIPIFINR
ncbi:hypothetical protein H0I31_09070 [Tenacibaculum sp. AHE15PA]|uniref:hypothetical protein n=1 Tax=unclassified Tenacibaculum TaxID=2635139 RepID=UPI001C4E680D|nr:MULTISPECIES: hypothetical protein [unclassified Tenacibaculum]QXP74300.1 hypothetical protein H0I30_03900 [Tenacibaculum sp. AHE14PA]QXP75330.1 hypothetical protein H0I31_09070 [Tenacibaculum sp. AHE15PA]